MCEDRSENKLLDIFEDGGFAEQVLFQPLSETNFVFLHAAFRAAGQEMPTCEKAGRAAISVDGGTVIYGTLGWMISGDTVVGFLQDNSDLVFGYYGGRWSSFRYQIADEWQLFRLLDAGR